MRVRIVAMASDGAVGRVGSVGLVGLLLVFDPALDMSLLPGLQQDGRSLPSGNRLLAKHADAMRIASRFPHGRTPSPQS